MSIKRQDGLAAHEAAVVRDLALLGLPPAVWTAEPPGPDGAPMADVLVVGAGMLGIAAAAAARFKGIGRVVVLDRAAPGREGPWMTHARMEFLRSPKHLPGPCLGIPSLTFRAWFEARYGATAWEGLYKVLNPDWQDYLGWLQNVLGLGVRHGVEVARLRPHAGHVEAVLEDGTSLHARRVVLATGRGGAGGLSMPDIVDPDLFPDRAVHSNGEYDIGRVQGRRVAVLGAGNSAWDHAAAALEAGALRVDMFARRTVLPQVNKGRGSANVGFFEGWAAWPPEKRWELLVYMHDLQSPPPHESVLRALKQPNLHVHLGMPVRAIRRVSDGVSIETEAGVREADLLILGTGYAVDLAREPALAELLPHIALWADRYAPPPDLERTELGRFPWLGDDFSLTEREPGACPALSRVHLFNHGAAASVGQIASDIPGVNIAAQRLASHLAQHFAREDYGQLKARLEAFAEPELQATPFFALG